MEGDRVITRRIPRFAAIVWDGGEEHVFSGETISDLILDIRSAFPAPAIVAYDPLKELGAEPFDTAMAARTMGVSKEVAHARIRRGHRNGCLIKLRRGVYQAVS